MSTVDKFLDNILTNYQSELVNLFSTKDLKVLKDLNAYISSPDYITENQSHLILRILGNNQKNLKTRFSEVSNILKNPVWEHGFRHTHIVRRMFIANSKDNDPTIAIEFTPSANLREIVSKAGKNIENFSYGTNGKSFYAALTERNIIALVNLLDPLGFDIEETIKDHYDTIKSWSETEIRNQFLLSNIEHPVFQQCIIDDLGVETALDEHIINDRSVRYQYFTENAKNFGENLTENLANRSNANIWIDKKIHSLTDVVESLIELKRLPLLVIFENGNNEKFMENLGLLNIALEQNGIFNGIGIYFRLSNDGDGKQFNTLIAKKQYNHKLDNGCVVAGIISGKIPKFFLTNSWKPMSVIVIDTKIGLRHGKTAVYSNCCDLIVEWSDQPAIVGQIRTGTWQ